MTHNILRHSTVILIGVISFRFMVRRHNSIICLKISSVSETCHGGYVKWLCKVNLRTNQMFVFSNNSLFNRNKQGFKRTLFNRTRQYNTQIFDSRVYYLFVSVALICFVLYLTRIILSKICISNCFVLLNSVLFKPCLFRFTLER